MEKPQLLQGAIAANAQLRGLGLQPLAVGNKIRREVWESVRGLYSPMQTCAQALDQGTQGRVR